MRIYDWDEDKNEALKEERGISFEEVVLGIENGHLLDILKHPDQERYPGQFLYVVEINEYAYIVPFIDSKKGKFLKTIFPSRKYTKLYLKKEEI